MGLEHCSIATREACWHTPGLVKCPKKWSLPKAQRWWYLQHFASSNFLLWGLSICYQVLAQILLSRCLARRFSMLSSTTSHQSKQKRRLLHLPKPQTKMKNMWEKCQLPWNSICKGGSVYWESCLHNPASCKESSQGHSGQGAVSSRGPRPFDQGSHDVSVMYRANSVCRPFFLNHLFSTHISEWFEAPQQVLKAHLVLKRSLPFTKRRGRELCWNVERNLRDILELYSKRILTSTILLRLW